MTGRARGFASIVVAALVLAGGAAGAEGGDTRSDDTTRTGDVASPAEPAGDAATAGSRPAGDGAPAAVGGASEAGEAAATTITGNSTLAEWLKATPAERSEVAVALARNHLPADATKLQVATAAMEITGCLTRTAGDARFLQWKVAPTAGTCLTAPEKPTR